MYYFEAARRTTIEAMVGGTLRDARVRVAVNGWIHVDAAGSALPVDVRARAFWGDEGGGGARPLGLLRVNGRAFWIMRLSGYESLGFRVDDVSATAVRTVVRADGGGC